MDKGNKTLGIIIGAFLALLLGAVFISSIATNITPTTGLTATTDTLNIAAARPAGKAVNESYVFTLTKAKYDSFRTDYSECKVETIVFKNQTGGTLTDPTDYVFTNTVATLKLKNVEALNSSALNTTTVAYSYCPDNYMGGWGATVLNLVPGFFALGMLGAVAFLLFRVAKSEGVNVQ
jgi:hypothetical protein